MGRRMSGSDNRLETAKPHPGIDNNCRDEQTWRKMIDNVRQWMVGDVR